MDRLASAIHRLVAQNRLRDAALALRDAIPAGRRDLQGEATAWLGQLTQADSAKRTEEISPDEYAKIRARLARRLLELLAAVEAAAAGPAADTAPAAAAATATPAAARGGGVFLSYNHGDAAAAEHIRLALERAGIPVAMDSACMAPGSAIRDFIRSSIRATDATVCVLSASSLLSGWVGQESALALGALDLWGERRFIACYLDTEFLDIEFRLRATESIDARLAEIEALAQRYAERRLDSSDLNAEKSRLFDLRHNLGAILDRLRGSLCLDLRPPARAASLARLVAVLQAGRGGQVP
ncbi:MAG: toll/interleukin-1 receptor domain-containing protein [Rhodocyclaceae bacterium]|nr:toll/interleukin-1 receptor domain-containing protein [Rhodocyclaceae bacterium]